MQTKLFVRFLFFVSAIFAIVGFGLLGNSLTPAGHAQTNREITSNKNPELNVSSAFWKEQAQKAMAERNAPTGDKPEGMVIPESLTGSSIVKQKAKMTEMVNYGYSRPMDFADLALKRMTGELVELPMATETYLLDVGGSVTDGEFTTYDFDKGSVALNPLSSEYLIIKKLADDFDGMKYDLQNASDRKQFKVRLLRMVTPPTKKVLEEIAQAYHKEFKMPLRLTSLVRSMEYQFNLSQSSANSFVVRGNDSFPPHVSGCAVDIGRRTMTAAEQNFVMKKLAEMKTGGKIDALVEYGDSLVFHFFVYWDGKPPKS